MNKRIYVIYNTDEKDSNVFSARSTDEAFDIAFQTIFDTEEFDEFFNDNGDIVVTKANKAYFFECLKGWKMYDYGKYDSDKVLFSLTEHPNPIDFNEYLKILQDKVVGL
ncbi:hypothetical protein [Tortoise microvirus 26]|nr:hypothetical protein [Tortoise microvirus 26]